MENYELALGQRLNKEKTSIFFSRNTKEETKDISQYLLGLDQHNPMRNTMDYQQWWADIEQILSAASWIKSEQESIAGR